MIINSDFARELALDLLKIDAVILRPNDPFTWTSGWNSPIYCDNRLTLIYPELRSKIADHLADYIKNSYPDVDVITGTATAGIPHAAWVAERLAKPMAYVRGKAKAHGLTSQIEGGVKKEQSTIIIEDLISTGGSVISVKDVLEFVGAKVVGAVSIFTYGFDVANKLFESQGLKTACLTDYNTLLDVAIKNGYIDKSDLVILNQWRENPDTWPR
ncbi:MAG: orotate phosphoribosyltransferase [Rhodothermaceae bacterium]|nr:orotate phosphoribosyltransferase [Rhodothermaceae bacterium]